MSFRKTLVALLAFSLIITLFPLALLARNPQCTKDGVEYCKVKGNFREEWYDYQERGLSCMEGGCYEPAFSDFEKTVNLRTALDRAAETPGCDQRRARTYGMHFEDYFGHRERGVALYHLGRIDESIKELEFSLKCVESSKAEYYLNLARQSQLSKTGGDTQGPQAAEVVILTVAPRIDLVMSGPAEAGAALKNKMEVKKYFTAADIESMKANLPKEQKKDKKSLKPDWGKIVYSWSDDQVVTKSATNQADVFVLVHSTDNVGVAKVILADNVSTATFAEADRVDMFPLTLDQGQNSKPIKLVDIAGNITSKSLDIFLDKEGPRVSIEDIQPGPSGDSAVITGFVSDTMGLQSLTLNGQAAQPTGNDGFKVTVQVGPDKKISFQAVDKIGNTTAGVIHMEAKPKGAFLTNPPIKWALNNWFHPTQFASNSDTMYDYPVYSQYPYHPLAVRMDRDFMEPVLLAEETGNDVWWGSIVKAVEGATDSEPPAINLKDFKVVNNQARAKVYYPRIYLEGNITDANPIKSLTINDIPLTKGERKNIFFNEIIKLKEGRNTVKIAATDARNNVSEVQLFVDRVVPKVHQVGNRMFVSMIPFYQGDRNKEIGRQADGLLTDALVNQQRFNFVDRSKIDAVIKEQKLVASKLTDEETGNAIKLGKLTGSENTILGLVVETPSTIEVTAQVIDNESSRILYEADAFHEDKSLGNLKFLMSGLAIKLANGFPVLEGKIEAAEGNAFSINLGERQMMQPGLKVLIFTEEELTDPDTGKPAGKETILKGQGKVVAAYDKMSRIELEKDKTKESVAVGNSVITK